MCNPGDSPSALAEIHHTVLIQPHRDLSGVEPSPSKMFADSPADVLGSRLQPPSGGIVCGDER
jgi:hypothetical protein